MSTTDVSCVFCDRSHYSRHCKRYGSAKERVSRAKELRLCARCLSRHHSTKSCTYRRLCRYCDGEHGDAVCAKEFRNRIAPSFCFFCQGHHRNYECTVVATVEERKTYLNKKRLCPDCFRLMRAHDNSGNCPRRVSCVHCKGRHNSALCEKKFTESARSVEKSPTPTATEKPSSPTTTQVETFGEQLLAQQEQLYELATSLEEEKASLASDRVALDKLKAELNAREKVLDEKATSIEAAKSGLEAERAELQLERSHIEAERLRFGFELESLKEEEQAKRLLQMDRMLRLHKELDGLKADNERLKLSSGQQLANDSLNRRRSLPLVDSPIPSAEKKSRVSY